MRRDLMRAPGWRRPHCGGVSARSSPILVGLLREPFLDAGEVLVIVVAIEVGEGLPWPALHFIGSLGVREIPDEGFQLDYRLSSKVTRCLRGGRDGLTAGAADTS